MYCYSRLRRLSSYAPREVSLYALLEVAPSASVSEIKLAFRQKAKLHHPDVSHKRTDSRHFAKILVAYQVLSNARQRQLYDLSLKAPHSSPIHDAAQQDSRQDRNSTESREGEWVPGAGWFAWATRTPKAPAANQIDKLRAELRHEFTAAVQHAYLGPRVQLSEGQLPEAFEGEERSVAGVGDVLQLVSGRQLLGVVRERQDACLPGGLALDRENLRHLDNGTTNSNASSTDSSPADCSSSSPYASNSGSDATMNGPRLATSPILELVLDGRPVAVAVRKRGKGLYTQKQHPGSRAAQDDYHNNHEWQHSSSSSSSSSQTGTAEPTTPPGKEGEMWTCIYSMDGTVLATEQEGNLHKDGVPGAHTHTVLTGQTPLVRHLHVLFTAAGQELSICRCRRAWLPPSSTWLFPPRSQDHTTGGWYFEWSGHVFQKHPAWLNPAVFVLLAAFDTLSHEAHDRAPGLHPTAGESRVDQPDSRTQQFKQWVSGMWQFHQQ